MAILSEPEREPDLERDFDSRSEAAFFAERRFSEHLKQLSSKTEAQLAAKLRVPFAQLEAVL